MWNGVQPGSQAEQVGRLILAGFLVIALPTFPFGNYVIYPFYLLTTWFHEMGHGMTAELLGQDFRQLTIFADGSGVAESYVDTEAPRLVNASIAAGGPLAPSMIGAGLIVASAHQRAWRATLIGLAAAILISVALYIRSDIGLVVLPLIGVALSLAAWKASDGVVRFTLQFLGILAAMSMFQDWDYLFSEGGIVGGQPMPSDTGQIEAALFLPHWFWAAAIILVSTVMIGAALKYALSDERRGPPKKRVGPKKPANVLQFKRK